MARGYGGRPYRMTASRRVALRKAQAASAKKRRRNKKIKIAAGTVGVGAFAVAGYKYGPKAGSIAGGLKARTPKQTRRRINILKSKLSDVVYPITKEYNRIKNGVTGGKVSGAGPDGPSKKPTQWKRTKVSTPTTSEIDSIRARLAAENYRRTPKGRQEAKGYASYSVDPFQGINQRFIGMPRIRGKKIDRKTAKTYITKLNGQRTSMGLNAYTPIETSELINRFIAEGTVRRPRRRRRKPQRKKK